MSDKMFSILLATLFLITSAQGSWMNWDFDPTSRDKTQGVAKIVNSSKDLPPRPAMVLDGDGNGILDLTEQEILHMMLGCMRNESNGTIPTETVENDLDSANTTEEGFIIVDDILDQYAAWKTELYHMNKSDYVDEVVSVCHNKTPGSPDHIRSFCSWLCRWDFKCRCTGSYVMGRWGSSCTWFQCAYVLTCAICKLLGCFPNSAIIQTLEGPKEMWDLKIGDSVLTASSGKDLSLHFTDVIGFTQFSTDIGSTDFLTIQTTSGHAMTTSSNHLIFSKRYPSGTSARNIKTGDFIWVKSFMNSSMVLSEVSDIKSAAEQGLISPLTSDGTILVDGVLMSCYAYEDALVGHKMEHAFYAPMRWRYGISKHFGLPNEENPYDVYGAHWYRLFLKNTYTSAKSMIF